MYLTNVQSGVRLAVNPGPQIYQGNEEDTVLGGGREDGLGRREELRARTQTRADPRYCNPHWHQPRRYCASTRKPIIPHPSQYIYCKRTEDRIRCTPPRPPYFGRTLEALAAAATLFFLAIHSWYMPSFSSRNRTKLITALSCRLSLFGRRVRFLSLIHI